MYRRLRRNLDSGRRARSMFATSRRLSVENLEGRWLMASDIDDQIIESIPVGVVSTAPRSFTDSISPDTDVDMYAISVTAGQTVDFDIDTAQNGGTGLGSYIRLFNSLGEELASNNDAVAPGETSLGFDAYLRYNFAIGGNYYLGISNANNIRYDAVTGDNDFVGGDFAIGSYSLTIQSLLPDADDTFNAASTLGVIGPTPSTINATINPDFDVDMYRFNVSAGQVVDFDIDTALNGPGGLGSYIRLFDQQGNQLAFNDDGAAPGESEVRFDAYLRYTFPATGTYYLGVSNYNNITYNPINGTGDTSGGLYSIGDYSLSVQLAIAPPLDNDDSIPEAIALGAVGTTSIVKNDSISPDVDVDVYSFSVGVNQTVDFDIDTALNGAGGLSSYLRLFNGQGTLLASNDNATAPGESTLGFDAYLRYTFSTAGTYYIAVSNANNITYNVTSGDGDVSGGSNATGDYRLTVQSLSTDTDDSISEAIPLGQITQTPVSLAAAISTDVDVDMYSFQASAGQTVDFDIDTALNGVGGLGSYLRLFNSSGLEISKNDDGAAPGEGVIGFDAYLRYTFTAAGTYYISVSNNNNTAYNAVTGDGDTAGGLNSTGDYTLVVNEPGPALSDLDDSISEAVSRGNITTTPISIGGEINPDIDVDIYAFTVTAGQVVDFDLDTTSNGGNGLNSLLRLFAANGAVLASNDNGLAPGEGTQGFDAYLRYTFTTAGTYYIGVSNTTNSSYDPLSGNGDNAGGNNATGAYTLLIQTTSPVGDQALTLTTSSNSISETGGTATATVTRGNTDTSTPLVVSLTSSDTNSATVPQSVTIAAGQTSATFTITAVNDATRGTRSVTITASSPGLTSATQTLQILESSSNGNGHNQNLPNDTNGDGTVSAIDALLVINYLNQTGGGPVPAGSPPYLDVNADGFVSAIDALLVINFLNAQSGTGQSQSNSIASGSPQPMQGEGESQVDAAPAERLAAAQETFSRLRDNRWATEVDSIFSDNAGVNG